MVAENVDLKDVTTEGVAIMVNEQSKVECTKCKCDECIQHREWLDEYLWGCVESLGGLVSQLYKERHDEWPIFKFRDDYGNEQFVKFDPPTMGTWEIIPDCQVPKESGAPDWRSRLARRGRIEARSRCTHNPPDICERCQHDLGQAEYDQAFKEETSVSQPLPVHQE